MELILTQDTKIRHSVAKKKRARFPLSSSDWSEDFYFRLIRDHVVSGRDQRTRNASFMVSGVLVRIDSGAKKSEKRK